VWVIHNKIHPSQSCVVGQLNSIEKTPKIFYSLHYRQSKNPAKAFVNPFIMEEAVAGTSAVATEIDIDIDNIIDSIDPIGALFDPSTPNTEVPTSITCNSNRSPRDKSIRDMVNKEDAFNRIPVMAPILALILGVHFLGEHISLKMGPFAPFSATIQRLSKTCALLSKKRSEGCFVWAAPSLLLARTYFIIAFFG
jgi:hypothetical protein